MDLVFLALSGLSIVIRKSKMGVLCSLVLLFNILSQPVRGLDP